MLLVPPTCAAVLLPIDNKSASLVEPLNHACSAASLHQNAGMCCGLDRRGHGLLGRRRGRGANGLRGARRPNASRPEEKVCQEEARPYKAGWHGLRHRSSPAHHIIQAGPHGPAFPGLTPALARHLLTGLAEVSHFHNATREQLPGTCSGAAPMASAFNKVFCARRARCL